MILRASAATALCCTLLFGIAGFAHAEKQHHMRAPGFQDDPAVVPEMGPEYGELQPPEELPAEEVAYEDGYHPFARYPNGEYSDGCEEMVPYQEHYSPSLFSRLFDRNSTLRQVMGQPGQIFVGAEYLHVRANFSEALAYVERNTTDLLAPVDTFHQLDFNYENSFGFYGGYRWNNCDEEIRFSFRRLESSAGILLTEPEDEGIDIEIPLKTTPFPDGGTELITSDVNVGSYNIGFAKTIPLGAPIGCGCSDSCDCGDVCGCKPCPAWDITWYGGLRYDDIDWSRRFSSFDDESDLVDDARSSMTFEGGGLRTGMEGRRYFGRSGAVSAFVKGDLSLLFGDVEILIQSESDSTPGQIATQYARFQNIIPVTDIEGGLTAHLTKNTTLTGGYLFSAWHDLGFREQFPVGSNLGVSYDDANILAFDGLFVRLEAGF